jgi:hypothetical protein
VVTGRAHAVVAHLASGERITLAICTTAEEAHERAQTFIRSLSVGAEEGWPLLGSAYVRPESVVSVHLVEEAARSWSGSDDRLRWGAPAEGPDGT